MQSQTRHSTQYSWYSRLSDLLFDANMPRLVQDMRREAGPTFQSMVRDLNTPMAPAFEREVARTLNRSGSNDLIPAVTLMPAMMERFGLEIDDFGLEERAHLHDMQAVCNRCPSVGRCWRAMRAKADRTQCLSFCPNAEDFVRKASVA